MTSGTNYFPYEDTPDLDSMEGAIIPLNYSPYAKSIKYSNYDVEKFSFIEFEIPYIDNKPILSFDWTFTSEGDEYENDVAFVGAAFKYEGNSYYEPIEWLPIDFAVGFGSWAAYDGSIYSNEQYELDKDASYLSASNDSEGTTNGYFYADIDALKEYESVTSTKLIIGAAEISITGSDYFSDNKFSIKNINLSEKDNYVVPGDDIIDEDYVVPGDDIIDEDYVVPGENEVDDPDNALDDSDGIDEENSLPGLDPGDPEYQLQPYFPEEEQDLFTLVGDYYVSGDGNKDILLSTNNGASQFEIETALGLKSGTLDKTNGKSDATEGSAIYGVLDATAGDILQFSYYFDGGDYLPYDDFAFVSINGKTTTISSIKENGDYGDESGY